MRTAIFVYEPASLNIVTCETDLELSSLDTASATLAYGNNGRTLARGVYKIVSNRDVQVTGDPSVFDIVVTTENKENDPTPPIRAAALVEPIGDLALHEFFAVPEAKTLLNP
jgi:hypothetical protein